MARATGSIGMGSVNVSGLGTLTDPLQRGLALQQQAEGQREDRYQKSLLGTADMIAKQQQMEPEAAQKITTATSINKIANHSGENKLPAPDLAASNLPTSQANQQQALMGNQQGDLSNNFVNNSASNLSDSQINTGNGGYLELLEERPVINKERLDVGKVTVTKHTRTKTINVPIELIEEYITVRTDYQDAESQDLLSGNYDDKT